MSSSPHKRKTKRYRLPPCPAYDIEGMESWLADQARDGWFLSRDGFLFGVAAFETREPATVRYRLAAAPHATAGQARRLVREMLRADGVTKDVSHLTWPSVQMDEVTIYQNEMRMIVILLRQGASVLNARVLQAEEFDLLPITSIAQVLAESMR